MTAASTDGTATAAIQISGQPYVTAANDVWSGRAVTRWNRSRIHRITGFADTSITFTARARAGGTYTTVAIFANGALVASQAITADDVDRNYTVPGLPAGSKTVEIWEPFQARDGTQLNTNADGKIQATYVPVVYLPPGAALVKNTANVGVIVGIDSLCDGVADEPLQVNGWCGQLRQAAQAAGQLLGYYDYGSATLCGDGRSAAQMAADCDRLFTNMGTVTPKLVILVRPNDYAYYNVGGFGVTAATYGTRLAAFVDALRALRGSLVVDVINTLPQTTAPPAGADSLASFQAAISAVASGRAWVTVHDGTAAAPTGPGLVIPGDYDPDQVHPNQSGHNKLVAWIRAFANIGL